jgi:DNA-binding NarL/FixJ family response regulator
MASRDPSSRPRDALRVAVGSDQPLVAESVATALHALGFEPVVVQWPLLGPGPAPPRRLRGQRRLAGSPPAVGLAVTDLTRVEQVHGVAALVTGLRVPWLVMAGVPRGAAWGGVYERGVNLVVASATGLDDVSRLLTDLAAGRKPTSGQRRKRRELIQAWQAFSEYRGEMTARLETLTDREEEVLQRLHEGQAVRAIAEQYEVAEATVRSQVKAILRKLDVNSQLAAVAAYEDRLRGST